MTFDMADNLLRDLQQRTAELEALDGPLPRSVTSTTQAFAH
jgi:hypothetical protein